MYVGLGRIEIEQVVSSNILGIGYDEESELLIVVFKGGTPYAYRNVPKETFVEFQVAESAGRYFAKAVKDYYEVVKLPVWLLKSE